MSREKKIIDYPSLGKNICGRLLTLDTKFERVEALADLVAELLRLKELKLVGRLGRGTKLVKTGLEDVAGLFSLTKERDLCFIAGEERLLQLRLFWSPPKVFDLWATLSCLSRLELGMRFVPGWEWQDALDMFHCAVSLLSPHWGELNREEATQDPTMCWLDGHVSCVPHLGTANYFGPEYCEYFGGADRVKAAGFADVVEFSEGLFVSLGAELGQEAYLAKRAEVEARLADPSVFDRKRRSPVPKFRGTGSLYAKAAKIESLSMEMSLTPARIRKPADGQTG